MNPVVARAMDLIFTLHADHEQNASTSTVRLAGSSDANPFACIAAGVACLWGPAHGGANEAALNMLREIGTVDRIPEFIAKVKDKSERRPPDGLRAPRLQELRSARDGDAEDGQGSARAARRRQPQPDAAGRPRARADRALGRVLHPAQALSQRRLLFGHRARGDRLPDLDVHGDLRARAHRRLDRALEGNDRRSAEEDRPAAPALQRRRRRATTSRSTSARS